ncbi:MAG: zinc ABC transporter substrate-binding protein [Anaerolineae bacterium]|nr:zinc ABC transporter substrate-binding protein [Anaerolineae bacterium]
MKQYICLILIAVFSVTSCSTATPTDDKLQKLKVVATTTFVGEAVKQIGDDAIDLTVLLSAGENPHSFEPTPRDMTSLSNADIVFINGVGLEVFLNDLLDNVGGHAEVVSVSDGIELHEVSNSVIDNHGILDPHVWMDPNNVILWIQQIANTLSHFDETQAAQYRANAADYQIKLENLDIWVHAQIAQIPVENRVLISDHLSFGYFADRYGLVQLGAVIPSATTEAQPSGRQIAALHDLIQEHDVQAIFVDIDSDSALSERVAEDSGIKIIALYLGSLTPPGSPADSYINFTRYNVNAIVGALKQK